MGHDLSLNVLKPAFPKWIAGRIETLLSHYYRPTTSEAVEEAAMMDWIKALSGHSQEQISAACEAYLSQETKRRPTPGDIRDLIRGKGGVKEGRGDRSTLTMDEAVLLETKILPTARRWLDIPGLREHGAKTLDYWGEKV